MAKKNDGQITPDNFLDAYKPVSPQRRTDKVDAEAETELPKVEETQEDNRKNPGSVLPRRQNGVVKTPKDYQDIFLRPNLGESMRYGKTYYVSKDDCKKIKALMRCFGDGMERFPLSVYIHNLLEYHFNEFSELIEEMMNKQQVPNPFQHKGMNPSIKTNTGNSEKAKSDYAEVFLTRVPIKHQRCIGITEKTLDKLKSVVRLIAQNNTTVRSYASAILREHLREYKFLHEIMRKVMYDKLMPGDLAIYQTVGENYLETYLCPDPQPRGSAWIHVDVECAEALKQIVSWADTGATIGSFTEAIILVHLGLNVQPSAIAGIA